MVIVKMVVGKSQSGNGNNNIERPLKMRRVSTNQKNPNSTIVSVQEIQQEFKQKKKFESIK